MTRPSGKGTHEEEVANRQTERYEKIEETLSIVKEMSGKYTESRFEHRRNTTATMSPSAQDTAFSSSPQKGAVPKEAGSTLYVVGNTVGETIRNRGSRLGKTAALVVPVVTDAACALVLRGQQEWLRCARLREQELRR